MKYLLLLHEVPGKFAELTAMQQQKIIEEYTKWAEKLAEKGHLLAGEALREDKGRSFHHTGKTIISKDGPYIEAKDVISGFFMIQAHDQQQAEAIVKTCPHLQVGHWIEMREVAET